MGCEPASVCILLPGGKWGTCCTQGAPILRQSLVLQGIPWVPLSATIMPQV